MSQKIPATIVTGFLGAGKTSLIRNLLENADGRRIALIINEFGDLGIDSEILKGCALPGCDDDAVVELANGCICCTVADDFVPTIEYLLNLPEPPDHILIETSGLALPKPLVKAFNWPAVRTRVTVDGVITVVDAPAVRDGLFAADPAAVQAAREADQNLDHESPLEELFEEQLACADMVVLNKTDLVDENQLAAVTKIVQEELRPAVGVIQSREGRVRPDVLLGLGAAAESDLDSRYSHHDDGEEHGHDDFYSFHVEIAEVISPAALTEHLKALVEAHGILRVKGFCAVKDRDMRLVVQGVGGRFAHYYDREWNADESRVSRLVVIGEAGLDEAGIHADLGAFAG